MRSGRKGVILRYTTHITHPSTCCHPRGAASCTSSTWQLCMDTRKGTRQTIISCGLWGTRGATTTTTSSLRSRWPVPARGSGRREVHRRKVTVARIHSTLVRKRRRLCHGMHRTCSHHHGVERVKKRSAHHPPFSAQMLGWGWMCCGSHRGERKWNGR